jgi:hypothetical protein
MKVQSYSDGTALISLVYEKSNELLSAFESFIANQKLLVVINFKVSVYEKSRRILKREEYVSQKYI